MLAGINYLAVIVLTFFSMILGFLWYTPVLFGATWMKAELDDPVNDGAWQNFRANVELPMAGYYEIWARATDSAGVMQPFAIDWNPKGYLNNSMHRVGLRVS